MGLRRLLIQDVTGLHYAVRIFVGTTAVWLLLRSVGDADAVWAVISVIVVTEPQMQTAWRSLGSRVVNTLIGCAMGMIFLLLAGPEVWVLPLALTATVLVCTYAIKLSFSWRIAPATAALIIASGVLEQSRIGERSWRSIAREKCVGQRRGLAGDLVHVEDLGAFDG